MTNRLVMMVIFLVIGAVLIIGTDSALVCGYDGGCFLLGRFYQFKWFG